MRFDAVEDLQALLLEFLQLPDRHGRGAHIRFVFVVTEHALFVVRRNEAVDDFVDRRVAFANGVCALQDLFDRHRAPGNGEHHVLQAVLDALADLDFTFARKQLDRTHFAHIDANGVGRAAEFAVNGRERRFGFRLGILFAHRSARALHEELLLVGRDFMHGNIEVAENVHNRFDRVVVKERIRDVVVDFAIGDVAALLAHADELNEARAAHFLRVVAVNAVAVRHRFADRLFLGGAALARNTRLLCGRCALGVGRSFALGVGSSLFGFLDLFDVLYVVLRGAFTRRNIVESFELRNIFVVVSVFGVDHVGEIVVVALEPVEIVVFNGLLASARALLGLGVFFGGLRLGTLRARRLRARLLGLFFALGRGFGRRLARFGGFGLFRGSRLGSLGLRLLRAGGLLFGLFGFFRLLSLALRRARLLGLGRLLILGRLFALGSLGRRRFDGGLRLLRGLALLGLFGGFGRFRRGSALQCFFGRLRLRAALLRLLFLHFDSLHGERQASRLERRRLRCRLLRFLRRGLFNGRILRFSRFF